MIEYQNAAGASVRCAESEVAGRRVAACAIPYSGVAGGGMLRFDVLERRFVPGKAPGRVLVGPADPLLWERAVARCPAGPVLVGPSSPAEEIRGAYAAAAEGAARAGRGVYLLDPDRPGLAQLSGEAFVGLISWAPVDDGMEARLAAAEDAGIRAGALLPIVPAWTDDSAFLERWVERAAAAGAHFVAPVAAGGAGEERRLLVEARARVEPGAADVFFEKIHHCDWPAAIRAGVLRFRAAAARRSVAAIPPRPAGAGEPSGNSAAAARLEERAVELEHDEHRCALLHAAARWIDESGRDLGAVVREGNFARVFPFSALAAEAEAAFRAGLRS